MATRTFCDRCTAEVPGSPRKVYIERHGKESAVWFDLCEDCASEIDAILEPAKVRP